MEDVNVSEPTMCLYNGIFWKKYPGYIPGRSARLGSAAELDYRDWYDSVFPMSSDMEFMMAPAP